MSSRCLLRSRLGLVEKLHKPLPRSIYFNSRPKPHSCCLKRRREAIGLRFTQKSATVKKSTQRTSPPPNSGQSAPDERVGKLLHDALGALDSTEAPQEAAVLEALAACEDIAKHLQGVVDVPNPSKGEESPATKLLFLDGKLDPSAASRPQEVTDSSALEQAKDAVSTAALEIVNDPKVFMTQKILKMYVDVQSLLDRPQSFPEVFTLYAQKPVPTSKTSPIKYAPAKPSSMTSAVPIAAAKIALATAIRVQNLSLCLDIISTTVCAPSFHRAKLFQRALTPAAGLTLFPVAAYTIASQLSLFQNTMSDEMATKIAFAGILAYVGFTASIGVVAITTANDHMERVTWAQGTPLRERWLREEERAMMDNVASAWGFKETWRRGEEEGSDWEALRELVGLRGMVLDRVELMEGME